MVNKSQILFGLVLWAAAGWAAAQDLPPGSLKPIAVIHGGGNPVAAGLARALGVEPLYNATQPSVTIVSPLGQPYPVSPPPGALGAIGTPAAAPGAAWQVAPGVRVYPTGSMPPTLGR